MNRRLSLSLLCLCILLLAVVPGCGEQVEGFVHVDNGSEELIVVYVDGKQMARIGPGRCRKLTLPLGERAFKVKQGDEVVYEQTHKLDTGDRPYRRPTYILNPDQGNRYCKVKVVYHDEGFGESDLADLITMISNSNKENDAGNQSDDESENNPNSQDVAQSDTTGEGDSETDEPKVETPKEKRETTRAIVRQYRELSGHLVAMGDDPFFQVEDMGNFFKPLPTVVYSRQSGDQTRTTLARIPKVLHDYLAEAALVKKPTVEQLERLRVAEDVTISYVPFR